MERTQEENNKIYISNSRINIDNYIINNEYKKAFFLLIIVLERLENNEKIEFIDYYSKKLNNLHNNYSHLDITRLNCKKS
jgi:hypothetical protein